MKVEYIYKIECTANNKVYIGRSSSYKRRRTEHFRYLAQNKHANPILQSAYSKYGKAAFVFEMIEECTADNVKDRELYWFKEMESRGVVLFNYKIATSEGGIDSRSHITRGFIFKAFDDKYDNNLTVIEMCAKYGISNATYYVYLKEWEELRGLKMPRSIQQVSALEKVADFVAMFAVEGRAIMRRIRELHLSHYTLRKHLPTFGLTFEDVRLDDKFRTTKDRALLAIAEYNNGVGMIEACKRNDVSIPSFYKYNTKEAA